MPRPRRVSRRKSKPSPKQPPISFRSSALALAMSTAYSASPSPSDLEDPDASSLPSDICDDYYNNLLEAGLELAGVPADSPLSLDLTRGLPDSPLEEGGGAAAQEVIPAGNRHFVISVVEQVQPDWTLCDRGESRSEEDARPNRDHRDMSEQVLRDEASTVDEGEQRVAEEDGERSSSVVAKKDGQIARLEVSRDETSAIDEGERSAAEEGSERSSSVVSKKEGEIARLEARQDETSAVDEGEQRAVEKDSERRSSVVAKKEDEIALVENCAGVGQEDLERHYASRTAVPPKLAPTKEDDAQTQGEVPVEQTESRVEGPITSGTSGKQALKNDAQDAKVAVGEHAKANNDTAPNLRRKNSRGGKPLSPSAAPFNPSKPAVSPPLSPSAAPFRPSKPAVAPPARPEADYAALPFPQMTFRSPADRADWELIEAETLSAYRHFKTNAEPGMTYTCPPMPGAKARLAMHRAAEVLGCRSLSAGEGIERRVVLTWTKNGMFQISEASVVLAVRAVLLELFPPANLGKIQSKARSRGDPAKVQMLEARKAKRKQQKLEAAVKVADAGVDPELVDILVERQDWYALDLLYKGVKVPGLRKKKKKAKAKAKAKAEASEEVQQSSAAMPMATPFPPPFVAGFVPPPPPPPGVGSWYPGSFPGPGVPGMGPYMGHVQLQGQMHFQARLEHATLNAKPLEKSNKGFEMLEKMGWKEGEGLGSSKEGRKEPLQPQKRALRSGLGN